MRRWAARYNRLLQATITPGIVDTQCGAKFAATELWQRIIPECREDGYAWDAEVIAVARALMIPVREVPIEWRHDDRSKVHVLRDGAAMVAATGRIWRNVQRRLQARLANRANRLRRGGRITRRATACSTRRTRSSSASRTSTTGGSGARPRSWPLRFAAPAPQNPPDGCSTPVRAAAA